VRLVVILAVLILVALALEPLVRHWRGRRPPHERLSQPDELVKDPVCQTYVVVSRAVTRQLGSSTVHFCSQECALRYARGEGRV
jgi:hypothetical protein